MKSTDKNVHTKSIEAVCYDLVKFTEDIIRIPSVTGTEEDMAKFLLSQLKAIPVDTAWIDGIGNVVGVLYGSGKGPNVMLNTHLDIVPAGRRENWTHEPFGAEVDAQGNIFGRGAADIKAGIASQFFAMKLLKELREQERYQVPR